MIYFQELLRRSLECFWFHHSPWELYRYYLHRVQCKYISAVIINQSINVVQFNVFFKNYFGDPWNVFDFIIVLGSFIDIIYTEVNVSIIVTQIISDAPHSKTSCTLICFWSFLSLFHIADHHPSLKQNIQTKFAVFLSQYLMSAFSRRHLMLLEFRSRHKLSNL